MQIKLKVKRVHGIYVYLIIHCLSNLIVLKMKALWLWLIPVSVLFLLGLEQVESKKYQRCELTRVLVENYNFDKTFLSNWICLVEHESELNTSKITPKENNSKNYGLFQINSKNYCSEGRKGGQCNKKCEDFSNDDIGDDIVCAKMIQEREGFKYWKGWDRFCRNPQNLPNLRVACNLRSLSPLRTPRGFLGHG
ncbi:lysozyme c-1 isoform X2 [Drosophila ananassae]|uniref:lysozyme c-1 isoform X2 n=1 Tax=Drosophila ananassae TaxID=7217 RepID=UPI001CFFAF87|nr:lysozyme c-1 isoform X2 [Drosophila ananassae]